MKIKQPGMHAGYIIFMLAACLIFQTAVDWSKLKDVPALISFAVGLTSLVLSIIAIIQNLVSGPNLLNSLQELSAAALGINATATNLAAVSEKINDALPIIGRLGPEMGNLNAQVAKIAESQTAMTMKAENFNNVDEKKQNSDAATIDNKLNTISLPAWSKTVGGQVALYSLARFSNVKFNFKLGDALNGADAFVAQYVSGYIAALIDIGSVKIDGSITEIKSIEFISNIDQNETIAKTVKAKSDYIVKCRKLIDDYIDRGGQPLADNKAIN